MSRLTMPVVFIGHGSPMMAIEDSEITRNLKALGQIILNDFEKPKAILAISGHWFTEGTYIQSAEIPEQIYDMYGFPQELYQVKYPVKGSLPLTARVIDLLGPQVKVNDHWGIDHGIWTPLVHMFPEADIPVVELSVSRKLSPEQCFNLGQKLRPLREEGYLILGSGNVVHNLFALNPAMANRPTPQTERFAQFIRQAIFEAQHENLLHFFTHPDAGYATPTEDHFYPLLYCCGAGWGETVTLFNDVYRSGTIAMASYVFGLKADQQ